jgi:hypothetical protein
MSKSMATSATISMISIKKAALAQKQPKKLIDYWKIIEFVNNENWYLKYLTFETNIITTTNVYWVEWATQKQK